MKNIFYILLPVVLFYAPAKAQWQLSGNMHVFAFAHNDSLIFAGDDHVSDNGGSSWLPMPGASGGAVRSIVARTDTIFMAASGIYRSYDNGGTWTAVNSGIPNPGQVYSLTESGGYLIAGTSGSFGNDTACLYRSADNGDSWTRVLQLTKYDVFYSFATQGNDVWVSNLPSGIFYSADNGATWSLMNAIVSGKSLGIVGGNLLAGTCANAALLTSIDKGINWAIVEPDVCGYGFAAKETLAFAATTNGFYYSPDSGFTWIQDNAGLPAATGLISIVVVDSMILVGTSNAQVFRRHISDLFPTKIGESLLLKDVIHIYPNPANEWLHVEASATIDISTVAVYDAAGKCIIKPDDNRQKIDVSSLARGVYFIEISTDKGVSKKKLLVQ